MASPYLLSNTDLQYVNCAGQDFAVYLAFLNPIAITTVWTDINQDSEGNWQPPGNTDCAALKIAPYCPIANLGPNRIGFVGEPLYFDGSCSCQRMDIPVVSYAWTVTGSPTATAYANNSQMSYVWSAPGIYTVKLTVTDRAGTTTTGVRQVMIYQSRQQALPGMTTLSGPSGSLANGGWQAQITTVNSQFTLFPPDALPVGTYQPLVIMVETRYEVLPGQWVNATIGPHGQFNPGSPYRDPRILFDGYVQTGTVQQDVDKDTLSFTCMSPQLLLNEAQAHLVGYYNCDYTSVKNGVPQGCKTSPMGQGFQVGGLMTNDVVQSILQYHSNVCQFHDLHMWNSLIPCAPFSVDSANAYYNPVFSTLSVNEGTIWQNLQDLTTNEWSQVYCERDGSIRVGPQVNFRGQEYWEKPWLYNTSSATAGVFLNLLSDLGYTIGAPSSMENTASVIGTLPMLPAQPMPVYFVHEFGSQPPPSLYNRPFQGQPDPTMLALFNTQSGPPLLCVFADIPTPDPGMTAPGGLLTPIIANWPQDLSIYPIMISDQENYTGRTSLVKLIGTLANAQTILTSWYPQNTFQITGDGVSTTVATTLHSGNWNIDQSHVVPDVTAGLNRSLVLNFWWEMARRIYFASNLNYNVTITAGLLTAVNLNDLVGVTRQNNQLGPHWAEKPFYVDGVSYQIDINNKTWQTSLTLTEITSQALGPIQPPPKVYPKW